jgi:hypothetical protein
MKGRVGERLCPTPLQRRNFPRHQCDQIGRFFAYWAIAFLGKFFEVVQIFGLFSTLPMCVFKNLVFIFILFLIITFYFSQVNTMTMHIKL